MLRRQVVDQLLDEHGLADAGSAEQPHLAALRVGSKQVDDLDPGLEDLPRGSEILDRGSGTVDRPALVELDLTGVVDRVAEQVEDSPERPLTHGHGDGPAGVADGRAAREAVGGVHRHRAHAVVTKVLLNLEHEPALARLHLLVLGLLHVELDLERVVDLRQVIRRERHLDDHPLHLLHAAEVRVVALFGVGALGGLGLGARFQGELLLPGWGHAAGRRGHGAGMRRPRLYLSPCRLPDAQRRGTVGEAARARGDRVGAAPGCAGRDPGPAVESGPCLDRP
jgi:hypothetical protein